MVPATLLKTHCQELSREAFLRRHPYPWLLRALSADERATPLRPTCTQIAGASVGTARVASRPCVSGRRIAVRLFREWHRFGAVPVAKSAVNPWRGRILVGRASNNDIVLRAPSVSKLHAHLRCEGGVWRLQDVSSSNGTVIDGRVLLHSDEEVALESGSLLSFGLEECEFIDGGELYDILAARAEASRASHLYPG